MIIDPSLPQPLDNPKGLMTLWNRLGDNEYNHKHDMGIFPAIIIDNSNWQRGVYLIANLQIAGNKTYAVDTTQNISFGSGSNKRIELNTKVVVNCNGYNSNGEYYIVGIIPSVIHMNSDKIDTSSATTNALPYVPEIENSNNHIEVKSGDLFSGTNSQVSLSDGVNSSTYHRGTKSENIESGHIVMNTGFCIPAHEYLATDMVQVSQSNINLSNKLSSYVE